MTHDMADLFLDAVRKRTAYLDSLTSPLPKHDEDKRSGFKH